MVVVVRIKTIITINHWEEEEHAATREENGERGW